MALAPKVIVQRINSERVTSLDFHPTKPWLLVSFYPGSLSILDYETQDITKSFTTPKFTVRSAKFIERKEWVVTGSDDMHIRVYRCKRKKPIKEFKAHTDYIRCVAVHPTRPYVLSASDDKLIKLWDWGGGWVCTRTFQGHSDDVRHVTFNPNNSHTFASSSLDGTIKIWNLESSDPNFTWLAHSERGVNCVDYITRSDGTYLLTGSDDRTAKVWDYQTKCCVQTLEGHTHKVSVVCFHPTLHMIITGSVDGSVRIWDATTYRLEDTLNYGLDRVWAVAYMRESHRVAIGCDEGTIMIKIGRELPVASMDSSGMIIWVKDKEIQTANIQSVGADIKVADGERLPLAAKTLGSCDFKPQSLQHRPDGRSAVVCGEGKCIIYTAQAWSKQFVSGLESLDFVWSSDGQYAVRESESRIKIFSKAFQGKKTIEPPLSAERIFGGTLLAVCSNDSICFYDWDECRLIHQLGYCVKSLYWADKGDLMAIVCDTSFYIWKYSRVSASSYLDSGKPEDEESAFELLTETKEQVSRGIWFGDCLIYTNSLWRLNYYIGGEVATIFHLERPMYLLGYLSSQSRLYLIDKEFNVMGYTLHPSLIKYKTFVICGDMEKAKENFPLIPKEHHNSVAHFLESRGLLKDALEVATDPTYRFHLTIRLKRLDVAKVDGECPRDDLEHLEEEEENAMSSALDEVLKVGLFSDVKMLNHYPSQSKEDEIPARLEAIMKKLKEEGSDARCYSMLAKPAEKEEILLVHEVSYVDELQAIISQKKPLPSRFRSIYTCKGSWEAAGLAAGIVIQACKLVMDKTLESAVAVVRPPGHHAEPSMACGFCLLNNVAIAARVLLDKHPVLKILIVDWDIHHGNGTQKEFWEEDRVLYFSVHRNDIFPCAKNEVCKKDAGCDMVGGDKARGFNINVSLPEGNYSDVDYMKIWDEVLIPVTKAFSPNIILISGGFDAAIDDPLGCCSVTPFGFYRMMKKLMSFANGKIVLALEGGYNLVSTPDCVYACLHALLRDDYQEIKHNLHYKPFESQLETNTIDVISTVRMELQSYWKDFKDSAPKSRKKLPKEGGHKPFATMLEIAGKKPEVNPIENSEASEKFPKKGGDAASMYLGVIGNNNETSIEDSAPKSRKKLAESSSSLKDGKKAEKPVLPKEGGQKLFATILDTAGNKLPESSSSLKAGKKAEKPVLPKEGGHKPFATILETAGKKPDAKPIEKPKASEKSPKNKYLGVVGNNKKKKSKMKVESYQKYIHKVLKRVHPDLSISCKAMGIMNNLVSDTFEKLCEESFKLACYNKKSTITSREFMFAARFVLPGDLAKKAVVEAEKALTKFTTSEQVLPGNLAKDAVEEANKAVTKFTTSEQV